MEENYLMPKKIIHPRAENKNDIIKIPQHSFTTLQRMQLNKVVINYNSFRFNSLKSTSPVNFSKVEKFFFFLIKKRANICFDFSPSPYLNVIQ